ncbi:MAG TPA: hypothetical protein PK530_00245 [Anaerolineales bacterium]|nr:hypothetical protein [Anaerolineales bacterium]
MTVYLSPDLKLKPGDVLIARALEAEPSEVAVTDRAVTDRAAFLEALEGQGVKVLFADGYELAIFQPTPAKSDRPVAVKIGALVYAVEYIERLVSVDKSTKLNGNILYNPCLIRVEAESDEQIQAVTVLHEILHGLLTQAGRDEHEEKDVEVLAYGLFDVLRSNPTLLEWLEGI